MAQAGAKRAWARGGTVFAGTVMVIIGIFQVLEGLQAIIHNNFYVIGNAYAYKLNTTAWGWIHLGIGVVVGLTGLFLFTAATWARVVGIGLAVISATANFFFIPYYPFWALTLIALNIFVIWSLANVLSAAGERSAAAERAALEQDAMTAGAGFSSGTGAMSGAAGAAQSEQRWPDNEAEGRHWRTEPVNETAKGSTGAATPQDAQDAERAQAARASSGSGVRPPSPGEPPRQ